MSDFIIRAAIPDDAAAIIAFWNPMIESGKYTAFDTPFTEEQERTYIANQTVRDIFHVAERASDGAVVGFQSMSPYPGLASMAHVGVIGTFVASAFQRQGIARQLWRRPLPWHANGGMKRSSPSCAQITQGR
ncbi:MAG: GNAT family N-acetyltransferase [Caldilineaceae bacterium]